MKYRRFVISEAAGCLFIWGTAALLHSVYDLSRGGTLAVIFGAVNESVWEHVKIITAAYIGYALLQLLWIKVPFRGYVAAKCCGLYITAGGVICISYLMNASGAGVTLTSITATILPVAAAQLTSYRLTVYCPSIGDFFLPAVLMLMLYYLMFFSFTAFPPRTDLFRDPTTGGYGIAGRFVESTVSPGESVDKIL